ncbi:VOC family protein [Gryllotalpicola ginsengisoli]|uniref:VOC family protein n=1 Tax=Gryllotalpicola ginsengisoli TaxID=444608 RepID=UPI0003B368A1|nr:VOC family protein [Gryllotalpicola ginsengisoli]
MIRELNHLGILVRDYDASVAFYTELGGRVVFERRPPEHGTDLCYLQLGQGLIELIGAGERPLGASHLAFLVDELEADFRRLVDAGCTPTEEPHPAATGFGRLGFVTGPAGESIELLQRDEVWRQAPVPHTEVEALACYALRAPDAAAAERFYREVIGLEERGRDGELVYLGLGADTLELGPGQGPFAGLALAVRGDRAGSALTDPDGVAVRLEG